jgi:hypothetical protein
MKEWLMQDEVVIARYSEDLDWVENVPDRFSVIIYNKGPAITSRAALKRADAVVPLRNVGRESDTFFRHIVNKAEFSDGYTVFLQGDPFEHSPDIIKLLNASALWQDLQPLSWGWRSSKALPPPNILAQETNCFLEGGRVRPEIFSLSNWEQLQFCDLGARLIGERYRELHELPEGVNIAGHFLRRCEWTDLAEQAERHVVGRFSYGALFAVRQNKIPDLPRRCVELALEAANNDGIYGYVLERLWLHMFGEPFLLPALSAASHHEDLDALPSRFVPQFEKRPLRQRIIPGIKRRVVAWTQ